MVNNEKISHRILATLCLVIAVSAISFDVGAELPRPCAPGVCGVGGPSSLVGFGRADALYGANRLDINQSTDKAILNWQSFNISAGSTVNFNQPNETSIALNRIYQNDASRILGSLTANGQVYLINQNGILFGKGAQINTQSLLATTLDVSDDIFTKSSFATYLEQSPGGLADQSKYASIARTPDTPDAKMGAIIVEDGASITSANRGYVMLAAPQVENRGHIATPDGQTLLTGVDYGHDAAGAATPARLYVALSRGDPDLRGFLVEVETGGEATNSASGEIMAERGNITLAGFTVNQRGVLTATTSVEANGSIRLQARQGVLVQQEKSVNVIKGADNFREVAAISSASTAEQTSDMLDRFETSLVTLGEDSVTRVIADTNDTSLAIDEQVLLTPKITVDARRIDVQADARVVATGGSIELTAVRLPEFDPKTISDSVAKEIQPRIDIADGAVMDVAGSQDVILPMSRNLVTIELRANELKDSPLQRESEIRGKRVTLDIRQGTPLADISGASANIRRGVSERLVNGGNVSITSDGEIDFSAQARIDISGGRVHYDSGYLNTTKFISQGQIIDISKADPDRVYDGIAGQYQRGYARWGVQEVWGTGRSGLTRGDFYPAYDEGHNAGSVTVNGRGAFDGHIIGDVTSGVYQRTNLPSRGQLAVVLVTPAEGGVVPTIDAWLTSERDWLSHNDRARRASDDAVYLPLAAWANDGLGAVTIKTRGAIHLPEYEQITFAPGSSLSLTAWQHDVEGSLTLPGGKITIGIENSFQNNSPLFDGGISLGRRALLDTAGLWTNDNPLLNASAPVSPIVINGGKVSLTALGDVTMFDTTRIDVSAGAWLDATGKLRSGKGGAISIGNSISSIGQARPRLELNGELSAYGLYQGGELTVSTPGVDIGAEAVERTRDGRIAIDTQFFRHGGFSRFTLGANEDGLVIADNIEIAPSTYNFTLDNDYRVRPSAAGLREFSRIEHLPLDKRHPASIALSSSMGFSTPANYGEDRTLTLPASARIVVEPGAAVSMSSDSNLVIEGDIVAPAGNVNLTLKVPPFYSTQSFPVYSDWEQRAVWLGGDSYINAAATAMQYLDERGQADGRVLDAGTVNITAETGFVFSRAGSMIDVSGSYAILPRNISLSNGSVSREMLTVTGSAGQINIKAADGFLLDGDLNGRAANVAGARGGSVRLELDPTKWEEIDFNQPSIAKEAKTYWLAREINIESDVGRLLDADVKPSREWTHEFFKQTLGHGRIEDRRLNDGQFDTVELRNPNLQFVSGTTQWFAGSVHLADGARLNSRNNLLIDSANLVLGGKGDLVAAHIVLGPRGDTDGDQKNTQTSAGDGELYVNADFIELTGNLSISGVTNADFVARSDIRLRGVYDAANANFRPTGRLAVYGDLRLHADQIYPATLTDFTIEALSSADHSSSITISGGNDAHPVLSAAGQLQFIAHRIEQGGSIKAPLGEISLLAKDENDDAGQIVLAPGSLTSTSAEEQTIPFGIVESQNNWKYVSGKLDLSYRVGDANRYQHQPPTKRILLDASRILVDDGAILDVSGGGDLLATEWIPGIGGSRDVLDVAATPNTFAILPSLGEHYAPYDPYYFSGQTPQIGDAVYLQEMPGLAAGNYTLLPARYALLPGAMLVTPTTGIAAQGQSRFILDGSRVVPGYRFVAGTDIQQTNLTNFIVRPSEWARVRSEYRSYTANDWFTREASVKDLPVPLLPRDAGRVQILAGTSMDLAGSIKGSGGESGRGGQLDLVAPRIEIIDKVVSHDTSSALLLASQLNQLDVDSVAIGAIRNASTDGTELKVIADEVNVAPGVRLNGREWLFAAQDTVSIGDDARIESTAGKVLSDGKLNVTGDAAVLRVSAAAQAEYQHKQELSAKGALQIGKNAQLSAYGSILVDGSQSVRNHGELDANGGALWLRAPALWLGDAAEVPEDTLRVPADVFAPGRVSELGLEARRELTLSDASSFNFDRVTIKTPRIQGASGSNAIEVAETRIDADEIRLTGLGESATVETDASLAPSRLRISANRLTLDGKYLQIDGYQDLIFAATNREQTETTSTQILFDEQISLSTPGNVSIDGLTITAGAGSDASIQAGGKIVTVAPKNIAASNELDLGGKLSLRANTITHGGGITMPSGVVNMEADGDVVLLPGSRVDLSGRDTSFGPVAVGSPGGSLAIESLNGAVTLSAANDGLAAAFIDLSSASASYAGDLNISAPRGLVRVDAELRAQGSDEGGRFNVDAKKLERGVGNPLAALAQALDGAGFDRAIHLRQQQGDLVLENGQRLRAHDIILTADSGEVRIDGVIDASGESSGTVRINAGRNTVLGSTAVIDAHATGADELGGKVEISSTQGIVNIAQTANIDVRGTRAVPKRGEDGNIVFRDRLDANGEVVQTPLLDIVNGGFVTENGRWVTQAVHEPETTLDSGEIRLVASRLASDVAVTRVDFDWRGTPAPIVEAVKVYELNANGTGATQIDSNTIASWQQDTADFMSHANVVKQRLGAQVELIPGIEIRSVGAIELATMWDFRAKDEQGAFLWRYDNRPGTLTVRARGDLMLTHSLSDGIAYESIADGPEVTASGEFLQRGRGWNYRLVGGADVTSADRLAVSKLAGDLSVSGDTFIRTAGDIALRAGRDLILKDNTSRVYTIGEPMPDSERWGFRGDYVASYNLQPNIGVVEFPLTGGDIDAQAARDIDVVMPVQPSSEWLVRIRPDLFSEPVGGWGWGVAAADQLLNDPSNLDEFGNPIQKSLAGFRQGFAVLGGGNIRLVAGGDVKAAAFIPTAGRPYQTVVSEEDSTRAQRALDVRGGGDLKIEAGGDIRNGYFLVASGEGDMRALGGFVAPEQEQLLTLELGAGAYYLHARQDMDIARIDDAMETLAPPFYYLDGEFGSINKKLKYDYAKYGYFFSYEENSRLFTQSLAGNIHFFNAKTAIEPINVLATAGGNSGKPNLFDALPPVVELYAVQGNIDFIQQQDIYFQSLRLFPSPNGQLSLIAHGNITVPSLDQKDAALLLVPRALTPVSLPGSEAISNPILPPLLHLNDRENILMIAKTGDIRATVKSSEPVYIEAGGSIRDSNFFIQNLRDSDFSIIRAGEDIIGGQIKIHGPGNLSVWAGRTLDLQAGQGIISLGNRENKTLAERGADVLIYTGMSPRHVDENAMRARYLGEGSDYAQVLREFVLLQIGENATGLASHQDFLDAFARLDVAQRNQLYSDIIFNELRSASTAASEAIAAQRTREEVKQIYERGRDAVRIYTGGREALGDLLLTASTIQTQDGGDIRLFVPGGFINVGLPVAGKKGEGVIAHGEGKVEIYSQGDVLVNQLRVFAMDGGDMLIWSDKGNIDAGRGAKTAISAPRTGYDYDANGNRVTSSALAYAGSGIRTLVKTEGRKAGDVILAAPEGAIDAGDAGIDTEGNLFIATFEVRNADNFSVGGQAVGASLGDTGNIGAGLASIGNAASDVSKDAAESATESASQDDSLTPQSDAALSFLDVYVLGFGEESNVATSEDEKEKKKKQEAFASE